MKFCQIYINATTSEEADKIINHLLIKRLIPGANVVNAPCKYWWEGKLVSRPDLIIFTTCRKDKTTEVEKEIMAIHSDKAPAIIFTDYAYAGKTFTKWMEEELK